MDFIAHQRTQGFVDELVAGKSPLPCKILSDNDCLKMSIIVTHDFDVGIDKSGFDQGDYVSWVHSKSLEKFWRARSVPVNRRASQHRALFVYDIRPRRDWPFISMLGNIFLVVGGLVLLIWGADRFVHGAAASARNLGVAPLLIGLTIVAFATSAPEILVSVLASLRGQPGLAFGNAIGSNIVNIGLVLGVVAIIRPIQMRSATLRREMPALLAVTLLTVSLFLDAYLSRIDGLVMLTGLVIVLIWLTRIGIRSAPSDPIQGEYEAEIPKNVKMPKAIFWLIVGLAALLLGAHLLVKGSISIAEYYHVSNVVVGILLVALGTSLPELAVSLVKIGRAHV